MRLKRQPMMAPAMSTPIKTIRKPHKYAISFELTYGSRNAPAEP